MKENRNQIHLISKGSLSDKTESKIILRARKFMAMETRFWIHKPNSPNFGIELNPDDLVIHALAKQVWKLSKSSEGKTPICPYIMRVYCGATEALAIKKKASFLPSFKVFFSFFPHFLHSFYGNPILCLSMLCFTNCNKQKQYAAWQGYVDASCLNLL